MPTLLFSLRLSRHIKGFGKPSVGARPSGIIGPYVDGVPHLPKDDEVRNALPHYYRKALGRTRGNGWFVSNLTGDVCGLRLYGSRGRYLNTVYAMPYMFTSQGEK